MIIEKYPFETYHEMNMDWILAELKKLEQMIKTGDKDVMDEIKKIQTTIITIQNNITNLINEVHADEQDITNIYNIIGFFISPVTIEQMRLNGFINDSDELKVVNIV